MTRNWLRPLVAVATLALPGIVTGRQAVLRGQERPLPVAEPFYAAVRANLARSDKEQYRYAYRERRSEVHTNPFGRLGTDGSALYQVTPGDEYGLYRRVLVERDGKPLTGEKPETIDRRGRSSDTNPAIDDVVETLTFRVSRRESSGGRDLIVVQFEPKRDAKPRTRQGKLAKAFKGAVWVDERTNEVVRVDATAITSLDYGLGILAWLKEGARVRVAREPIDTIWLPTSIRLNGEGRALLVRKLDVDYFIEWFDYRRMAFTGE
jgi:hypothetical protein